MMTGSFLANLHTMYIESVLKKIYTCIIGQALFNNLILVEIFFKVFSKCTLGNKIIKWNLPNINFFAPMFSDILSKSPIWTKKFQISPKSATMCASGNHQFGDFEAYKTSGIFGTILQFQLTFCNF